MAAAGTEEQLAWEARQRPRAAVAAILAALLTFGAEIFSGAIFRDVPSAGLLDSLERAVKPGPIGGQPSARTPFFEFYDEHRAELLTGSVARALGLLALGWAVTFLAVATRGRRPQLPRIAIPLALTGAVLLGVSRLIGVVASSAAVSDFLAGSRSVDAARDISGDSTLIAAKFMELAGQLALAAGFVLVSLNAMRVGLLTRFIGILGIIVGALVVIPIGPVQVVQPFWLVAVGMLFAGWWPNGIPPAWRTGRAEPWPSQREVAEDRRRAVEARKAARRGEPPPAPEPDAEPEAVAAGPQPASRKRKRKRRG